jgi:hypothetical protein
MKLSIYSSRTRGFNGRIFVVRTVNMDVDGLSKLCQWKTNADMLSVILVSIFRLHGNIVLFM